jgi:hypothetical protein
MVRGGDEVGRRDVVTQVAPVAPNRIVGWFAPYRSALGDRNLRLLLGGLVVSTTGTWAYNVALLAFVFDRTHSLGWVGAASIARFVPPLVLSAYAGVIAERFERIRLMAGSDVLCAVWQTGLAIAAVLEGPVVVGLALVVLTSATNVVYEPSVAATLPGMVGEGDLVAANALNGIVENVVVIAGPAIGAVLLLIGSPSSVFVLNAATFVVSALLVSRITIRTQPVDVTAAGRAGPLTQMAAGVKTIARTPAARTFVAFSMLISFVYGSDQVLFIAVSQFRLGTGSQGFGYLVAGVGLGGILMALAVERLAAAHRLAPIILAAALAYCSPTALLAVVQSPALAFMLEVVRGGATLVVEVLTVVSLQRTVPADRLARVFGAFLAFSFGAIFLGTLVTPLLVNSLGLNASLVLLALVPSALAALGFPALLAIDRDSSQRAAALAPRVAVLASLDMFARASQRVLERLAGIEVETPFPAGTTIVREGEPADALYVLIEGDVAVTSAGEIGGPRRPVRTMAAPSYFGEIGVLEHIPRTATVTALTDCRCERIDGDEFILALHEAQPSSSLRENVHRRLAMTHPSRIATFAN